MNKQGLVYCIQPEQYDIFDNRIVKPVCIKQISDGQETGSMIFQEIDEIRFSNKTLTYFPPNNIGLLLSISKKNLENAKQYYEDNLNPLKVNHSFVDTIEDKKEFLKRRSTQVADYIELIQTCIVFGYTTLEAFANLSLTDDYKYNLSIKNKGIIETYDKKAIERWISLADKISKILPEIYVTGQIEHNKIWDYFVKLEKYRHNIIHQKSVNHTEFYKTYFQKDIFNICSCPEQILKFFYNAHSAKQKTNQLWPWLVNRDKEFPLTTDFQSENFEVIGNLFEGKTSKKKK